jgi:predicted enzyme related to lactoylglutathione lyase
LPYAANIQNCSTTKRKESIDMLETMETTEGTKDAGTGVKGRFIWYDLMTTDVEAAAAFYGAVVGWTAKDSGVPGQTYTLLSAGPDMVAGLMPIPPHAGGAAPGWMGYMGVDDVDAYTKTVQATGGTVHREPQDIPGVGRFSVVADPQGAAFMFFTPKPGSQGTADAPRYTPGRIGWHELHAMDGDKAFAYYAATFGWTKTSEFDMRQMGIYHIFSMGGPPAGGIMTKLPQLPVPMWLYYFNVEAIDAAAERIRTAGGQVTLGPTEVPDGSWVLQGTDPQGARFALVAPKR